MSERWIMVRVADTGYQVTINVCQIDSVEYDPDDEYTYLNTALGTFTIAKEPKAYYEKITQFLTGSNSTLTLEFATEDEFEHNV